MLNEPDGLTRNNGWGHITDFSSSMEVTGDAGDFRAHAPPDAPLRQRQSQRRADGSPSSPVCRP